MNAFFAPVIGFLGVPELVIILLIVVLIFGASRLPQIGEALGKGIQNFKKGVTKGGEGDDDEVVDVTPQKQIDSEPVARVQNAEVEQVEEVSAPDHSSS